MQKRKVFTLVLDRKSREKVGVCKVTLLSLLLKMIDERAMQSDARV
jgi:hypothetical protein